MHITFLLVFVLWSTIVSAKSGRNCKVRQVKINLIDLGLEYEMELGVNVVLDFLVSWQLPLEPASDTSFDNYDSGLSFFVDIGAGYYVGQFKKIYFDWPI